MPGDIEMIRGDGLDDENVAIVQAAIGDGDDLGTGGLYGLTPAAKAEARRRPPTDATPSGLYVRGAIDECIYRIPFVCFQAIDAWAAAERPGRQEIVDRHAKDPVGLMRAYLADVATRDLMDDRERAPDEREYDFAAGPAADLPALFQQRVNERAAMQAQASMQGVRERAAQMGLTVEQADELVGISAGGPGMPALALSFGGRSDG